MKCLEKEVRLTRSRKGRRTHLSVIREHYLRDDISCKVGECLICQTDEGRFGSKGILTAKVSHYAIPDVSTLSEYLEVFEHPGITNCILLQSALTHIRSKVGRQRAKSLLSSRSKDFVIFSNEHYFETFSGRRKDETSEEWQQRLVYSAGVWYSNHLQVSDIRVPIVIVTARPQNYSKLQQKEDDVFILSIDNYLKHFWPTLADLHKLYQSLADSIQSSLDAASLAVGTSSYLPQDVIHEYLKKGLLCSGRLKVGHYHPRDEATVTPLPIPGGLDIGADILISGAANRNRAIHGDVVAVRLLPRPEWRSLNKSLPTGESQKAEIVDGEVEAAVSSAMPSGVVVGILERPERLYVASFDDSSSSISHGGKSEKVLVYPYDIRIPKVRISTRQAEDLKNHRIVIHIDSWEEGSQYPNGHFVRSIGPIGDIETETEVILIEHELTAKPFSKALLQELPKSCPEDPWKVDENSVTQGGRRDLRHTHLVMSIDPKGCEDVDDALSVRSLDHGFTELGVHIADVSHFVTPGSLTDDEARQRSTTIYMADRRYDMLPAVLSADLCSLLSQVDRYAVSVIWKLDPNYHVKEVWFGRTVIRSRYKLAYETAQALYDGVEDGEVVRDIPELQTPSLLQVDRDQRVRELREAIQHLVRIARVMRERRGGLELDGVEVRVEIADKDKTKVEDLIPKLPLEMHEVIAECMIFANHWVAKRILKSYPTKTLLRNHPPPSQDRFSQLRVCAGRKGFTMDTQTNKALAHTLDRCVDPENPDFNRVLRYLAIQAMVQAQYCSTGSLPVEEYNHYGLDLDLYTHFTSPIRRYADLVVHRQLLAAVGADSADPDSLPGNTQLHEMTRLMNKKRRSAQLAQISSTELFQGLYFLTDNESASVLPRGERHIVDGVVISLRSNGVVVLCLRYGIRAPVYLRDKHGLVAQPDLSSTSDAGNKVVFDSGSLTQSADGVTVSYPGGQYTLGILDHIRVCVTSKVSRAHGYSLTLQLLSCGPMPLRRLQYEEQKEKRKLVEMVQEQAGQQIPVEAKVQSPALNTAYQQSSSKKSLYFAIQKMRKLSLKPLQIEHP